MVDDELDTRIREFTRRVVAAAPAPPDLEPLLAAPPAPPPNRWVTRPRPVAVLAAVAALLVLVAVAVVKSGSSPRPAAVATAGGARVTLAAQRDDDGRLVALAGASGDTLHVGPGEVGDGMAALCFSLVASLDEPVCMAYSERVLTVNITVTDGVRRLLVLAPSDATTLRVDIGDVTVWQELVDGVAFVSSLDVEELAASPDPAISMEAFDRTGRSVAAHEVLASPDVPAASTEGALPLLPPEQLSTAGG